MPINTKSLQSLDNQLEPCSDEWNLAVEKAVVTGDGQGHGPDTGSQEWRSVVLFKLGKRDAVDAPDLESERWCEYVDKLVFD